MPCCDGSRVFRDVLKMGSKAVGPSWEAAQEAAQRIHDRRKNTRDESRLPDPSDLGKLVEWVQANRSVDHAKRLADHSDVLVIIAAEAADLDRRQRVEIEAARAVDMTWIDIAVQLGMRTPQSAESRLKRLQAAAAGETRHEATARQIVRQRAEQTAAAADLTNLIRRTAIALTAWVALPRACFDDLAAVLWYFDKDGPAVPGPGLITVTRDLLESLAPYEPPAGCGDLLAEVAAKLPRKGTS